MFSRQKPLAGYITDFHCAKAKLVIELDGSQHFEEQHRLNDAERTRVLEALGLEVLRFDNRQVLLELDGVVEVITKVVGERCKLRSGKPPHSPFFKDMMD